MGDTASELKDRKVWLGSPAKIPFRMEYDIQMVLMQSKNILVRNMIEYSSKKADQRQKGKWEDIEGKIQGMQKRPKSRSSKSAAQRGQVCQAVGGEG